MNELPEFIECGDVVSSDRRITETEAGRQIQFVPRADIRNIVVRYGCAAHRPVAEFLIGTALSLLGLAALYGILTSGKFSRYDTAAVMFGAVGGYVIYSATRKYHYLRIETASSHFNIRFASKTKRADINAFCDQIKARWNYQIANELPFIPESTASR